MQNANILTDNNQVYNGFLYEIKKPDIEETKGYLFGTIHYAHHRKIEFNQKIEQAIAKCNKLYLELSLTAKKNEELSLLFNNQFEQRQIPRNLVQYFHQKSHSSLNLVSIDKRLAVKMSLRGGTYSLETNDEHVEGSMAFLQTAIDQLSKEEQDRIINLDESQLLSIKLSEEEIIGLNASLTAYIESDSGYFKRLLETQSTGIRESLFKRNEKMTERVIEQIEKPGDSLSFIAVGTLHLYEPKGMVNLLREKGYQVKKIKASA